MPPRKKPNSSSSSASTKKPNSSSSSASSKKANEQPSKYGIQHFFDRHTILTSQKLQAQNATPQVVSENPNDSEGRSSQNPITPSNSVLPTTNAEETASEVSPEISKSVSLKRFKFSPGMFIKQSQDDGADEVTWKISPVNERLQAVSKHMPKIIQALADSSRINLLPIRSCSGDNTSLDKNVKVEKLLVTPTPNASARALVSMSKLGLKQSKPDRAVDFNGKASTLSNCVVADERSPFRTPPSLSYRADKLAKDAEHNGPSDQLFLRQHKKALLELLDQVEDAITVDDTVCNKPTCSIQSQDRIANELSVRVNNPVERTKSHVPKEVVGVFSTFNYLVLEVSEKCQPTDSFSAQCPYKVLRLLNEQTGEERVVNLKDECWVILTTFWVLKSQHDGSLLLSQGKYIRDLLLRLIFLRLMTSLLLWLLVVNTPRQVCQFMAASQETHCCVVKRILRYLRGLVQCGLKMYPASNGSPIALKV